MSVFETIKRKPSVLIAKDRLKILLVSDRVNCTPDALEKYNWNCIRRFQNTLK